MIAWVVVTTGVVVPAMDVVIAVVTAWVVVTAGVVVSAVVTAEVVVTTGVVVTTAAVVTAVVAVVPGTLHWQLSPATVSGDTVNPAPYKKDISSLTLHFEKRLKFNYLNLKRSS